MRADWHRAAGAAPVCCGATPVDEAVGCIGVQTAALHGVLIFAVGTAGSGTVVGATGAVDITAGCECPGGAPGHSGVAGATLPGEGVILCGALFLHGIRVSLSDVVTGMSICFSTNNLDQVGAMISLSKDGGGQPKCLGIV